MATMTIEVHAFKLRETAAALADWLGAYGGLQSHRVTTTRGWPHGRIDVTLRGRKATVEEAIDDLTAWVPPLSAAELCELRSLGYIEGRLSGAGDEQDVHHVKLTWEGRQYLRSAGYINRVLDPEHRIAPGGPRVSVSFGVPTEPPLDLDRTLCGGCGAFGWGFGWATLRLTGPKGAHEATCCSVGCATKVLRGLYLQASGAYRSGGIE